jgi:hypothetical protein
MRDDQRINETRVHDLYYRDKKSPIHLDDIYKTDPAEQDQDLKSKIDENRIRSEKKIEQIMDEFSNKVEESLKNENDNDEEEEDAEDEDEEFEEDENATNGPKTSKQAENENDDLTASSPSQVVDHEESSYDEVPPIEDVPISTAKVEASPPTTTLQPSSSQTSLTKPPSQATVKILDAKFFKRKNEPTTPIQKSDSCISAKSLPNVEIKKIKLQPHNSLPISSSASTDPAPNKPVSKPQKNDDDIIILD